MVGPPHPTVWGCAGAKPQGHRMAVHFYVRDVFRQTVQTLWSHKLRSFLTMFGITWGVLSLLLLGSVGEGFRIGQRRRPIAARQGRSSTIADKRPRRTA